jgi:DNA polymerase III epsilon subunit-like protein
MKENITVLKLPRPAGGFKYPRLSEAAAFYGLAPEADKLHGSEYDAQLTYNLCRKMLADDRTKARVSAFLNKKEGRRGGAMNNGGGGLAALRAGAAGFFL